ncbi:hypothetical protein Trydic_g6757 [Trypoxylus dichotomus]
MEIENRNQLPFLDVLLIKKQNGTLAHTIYRKRLIPTATSMRNHTTIPHSYKEWRNAYHIRTESNEIKHTQRTNTFTTNTINRAFHAKTNPMDTTTYVTKTYLPYIKG